MTGPLVVGVDAGGTTTRVVVAELGGRVVGAARGEGGNPVAHGESIVAERIAETLRAALAAVDPADVAAAVAGLAGARVSCAERDGIWRRAGLPISPLVVSDVQLAFVAGTDRPDGTVLVAGTGAVAAECRGRTPVRYADGHGWLLGDRGSGYWLGREAVQLTLAQLDRGDPPTGLCGRVLDALLGASAPAATRTRLLGAVYAEPPVRLARLAPLVLRAAGTADPDALHLVERAADHLLAALATVRPPDSHLPVVLAGGVLTAPSPLAAAVRRRIAARWPGTEPTRAGDPAGAAAWLAARELGPAAAAGLHGRFCRTRATPTG